MVKKITTIQYQCKICREKYDTDKEALHCEGMPILYDKGVKVGETVKVTYGDGTGQRAIVKRRIIQGPCEKTGLVHCVALEADVVESWGTRFLQWNAYDVMG